MSRLLFFMSCLFSVIYTEEVLVPPAVEGSYYFPNQKLSFSSHCPYIPTIDCRDTSCHSTDLFSVVLHNPYTSILLTTKEGSQPTVICVQHSRTTRSPSHDRNLPLGTVVSHPPVYEQNQYVYIGLNTITISDTYSPITARLWYITHQTESVESLSIDTVDLSHSYTMNHFHSKGRKNLQWNKFSLLNKIVYNWKRYREMF